MNEVVKETNKEINGIEIPIDCLHMYKTIDTPDTFAHYHSYIELLYLTDGEMNVWLNDKFFEFKQGDLVVVNSEETHQLVSLTPISNYIVVKFLPNVIYDTQQSLLELKYILPFVISNSKHQRVFPGEYIGNTDIPRLMLHAVTETENAKVGWELAVRADILNIFLTILRYWDKEGVNLETPHADNDLIKAIQLSVEYINENFVTVTEKEAAEKCGLSYSYFSRSFKRIMTMSFTEYVNYLKITQAQKMLLTTDISISDTADALGFSSSSHFIQTFKKFKGCSPKKFKQYFSSNLPVVKQ